MGERPTPQEPLKSYRRILDEELVLADAELNRPGFAIAASGLLAGLSVCVSVLLIAVLHATAPDLPELTRRFFSGAAYATGFLLVIFARADLFTEYTTVTLLPVMLGRSSVAALGRLWGLVYAANLVGVTAGAAFIVALGAAHAGHDPAVLADLGARLVDRTTRGLLLSAVLVGWLMGLLSWLIVAARETTSQLLFVFLIGTIIGFAELPHCITGSAEVLGGIFAGSAIEGGDFAAFLGITTTGNALGSVAFALVARYAVARPTREHADEDARGGGPAPQS